MFKARGLSASQIIREARAALDSLNVQELGGMRINEIKNLLTGIIKVSS